MPPPPPPPPPSPRTRRLRAERTRRLLAERAASKHRRSVGILWTAFASGVLASVVFLTAMSATGWVSVSLPPGTYRNATRSYVLRYYGGLWRTCWTEWDNSSTPVMDRTYCRMRRFLKESSSKDFEIDQSVIGLRRAEAAFSVLSLLLSAIPNFFTWYSIQEPRYMFKRLAGSLHFITAGCIVVCIQVFKASFELERRIRAASIPVGAVVSFGYAMYMAWASVALFVAVGLTMFVMSAKKKGDRATSDREAIENEPVIIGRI